MNQIISSHPRRGNRWRIAAWGALAALLLVPAIAMQFTSAVSWKPGDFIVMGGMLVLFGLAVEFAFIRARTVFGRTALTALALGAFLLVWAEFAVGLFN